MEDTKAVEYEEREESGLTLGEIFKVIFRRVWWVIGAMAVCLVALTLVVQFWYNKEKQVYSTSYEIVYPDNDSGKYPDGSDMFAGDSISLSTLTDIKNGRYSAYNPDEFKDIDVKDMYENDNVHIAESITRTEDGHIRRVYTLTVGAKYFTDDAQANAFIHAIASYPVNRVNSVLTAKNYEIYLPVYDDAITYDEAINALLRQRDYLESEYTKLGNYGEVASVGIASLHNIFTESERNELKAHILAKKLVRDVETFKREADTRIAALEKKIEENEAVIRSLRAEQKGEGVVTAGAYSKASFYADSAVTDPYDAEIARLTVENTGYRNNIDEIRETLDAINGDNYAAEKAAFDERLAGYRAQLMTAAQTLKATSIRVYNDNSRAVFTSNKLEAEGGMHWVIAAVLGAVLGFVLSAIVVLIVDLPKYRRNMLAAATGGQSENAVDSKDIVAPEDVEKKEDN